MMYGYSIDGWWESYVAALFFIVYPLMLIVTLGLAIADTGRWLMGDTYSGRHDFSAIAIIGVTTVGVGWAFSGFGAPGIALSVIITIELWTVLAALLDRHPTVDEPPQRQRVVLVRVVPVLFLASSLAMPRLVAFAAIGAFVGTLARLVTRQTSKRLLALGVGAAVVSGHAGVLPTAGSGSFDVLSYQPVSMWLALAGAVSAVVFDVVPRVSLTAAGTRRGLA